MTLNRKYGWKPSLPDHRDQVFGIVVHPKNLPAVVDLRPRCPVVYDQGDLGSCTANAIAAAIEFDQIKENKTWDFMPARLFIYYNERALEGTINSDSGAAIRDGIKVVNKQGVCKESMLPYNIATFTVKPSQTCYTEALLHKSIQYQNVVQNLNSLQSALATGYPVIFGFTVYESFESDQVAKTGIVPMPAHYEQCLGGHAVLCVGYDNSKQMFLVRNSWGPGWGVGGYFWMPYAYMTNPNLASDFWVISTITNNKG